MSLRSLFTVALIAGVTGASGTVHAATCYQIVDDSGKTLYRATVPPFPMDGSAWNAAESRLRTQRHYFMWFDSVHCPEDFSSPEYAGVHAAKDANAILAARDEATTGTIYTGAAGGAPAAAGRAPVYVVPRGGRVAMPVGGSR
jgi:hypothetical protein